VPLQDAHVTACVTGMDRCGGCRTTHFILQKKGSDAQVELGRRRPPTNLCTQKAANYVCLKDGLEAKSPSIINPISAWSQCWPKNLLATVVSTLILGSSI
jgi:hypothetical protein